MSMIFSFTVAALAMGILVVHECGHYYSAKLRDGDPDVPIIIPLGVAAVGVTRVRNLPNLSSRTRRYIIATGPVAGLAAGISLLPYAIVFGSTLFVLSAMGLIAMELYGGTLGSDGSKWRREQNQYESTR